MIDMRDWKMSDCRTCKHNGYADLAVTDHVICHHPLTLAKQPRWQPGDPAWVNMLTADVPISRLSELANCPTYEAAAANKDNVVTLPVIRVERY
jgi:hypothetical protein